MKARALKAQKVKPTSGACPKKSKKSGSEESLENFIKNWDNDDSDESDDESLPSQSGSPPAKKAKKKPKAISESESDDDTGTGQKQYLANLEAKDPDFFKFLRDEDKQLLNMDESEESSSEEDERGNGHVLPNALEMASDESDFEDTEAQPKQSKSACNRLTSKTLATWEEKLAKNPSVAGIKQLTEAFQAALKTLGEKSEDSAKSKKGKAAKPAASLSVEGGALFNAVIRSCLTHLEPALRAVLRVEAGKNFHVKIMKSSKWKALNGSLKSYTLSLLWLINAISDASVKAALLKHVHVMLPYYAALPKSCKHLVSQLVSVWSSAEGDSVRILAFLCLVKLTRTLMTTHYDQVTKQMYLAYVKNAKFTSPTTWPKINFMRRSLAEVLALNPKSAYNHAFVYIRQLGIILRSALNNQKKEQIVAVYNWQFVHSLHLWAQLLSDTHPSDSLEPLLYPLSQVITGSIKLVYTTKYWPLRLHLCRMLTLLSEKTDKFIPVLPYYLDILRGHNFNKKASKVSMKPVDFSCILRLSKAQCAENGTYDTTVDQIHRGILLYLSTQGHKIAFPELVLPTTLQLKAFLKKNKVTNYSKKMKQVLDKIQENSRHIEQHRKSVTFAVTDGQAVATWEAQLLREKMPPIAKLVTSWTKAANEHEKKLSDEKVVEESEMDKLINFVPSIKRKQATDTKAKKKEMKGLLDSDSDESEVSDDERFERAEKRRKLQQAERDSSEDMEDKEESEEERTSESEDGDITDMDVDGQDDDLEDEESGDDHDEEEDKVQDLRLEDIETDEDEPETNEKPQMKTSLLNGTAKGKHKNSKKNKKGTSKKNKI